MQDTIRDHKTYVSLNETYGKDKNHVFFIKRNYVYNPSDLEENISQLETYLETNDKDIHFRLSDEDGRIYDNFNMEELRKESNQREYINKEIEHQANIMKDEQDVIYILIEGADLETFEVLGMEYGKDKNTLYYRNHAISKLILNPSKRDNPIEPISTLYYTLEGSILSQIDNPSNIQIVGHYNWNSVILNDGDYLYLYFLDENCFEKKIKKIFHFPTRSYDILEVLYDNSYDCYLKGNNIIYNYNQENGGDNFSIVEGVDFDSFEGLVDGGRDKFNKYEFGKIDHISSIESDEVPF